MTGLELTVERFYQTNSHNIHFRITGLVRRFSRRRNCPQEGYNVVIWSLASHSSILAWRIPRMGEPGGRPSMRSHRVGLDWRDLAAAAAGVSLGFPGGVSGKEPTCQCRKLKRCRFDPCIRKIPWRRAWQPTPVFLPGESQGWGSLVGYSLWGHKEPDTTEVT